MASQRPGYWAYLLRLWQVPNGEEIHWRGSLQDAHTGERHGFAGLEALFGFLRTRTEGTSPAEPGHKSGSNLTAENAEDAKD